MFLAISYYARVYTQFKPTFLARLAFTEMSLALQRSRKVTAFTLRISLYQNGNSHYVERAACRYNSPKRPLMLTLGSEIITLPIIGVSTDRRSNTRNTHAHTRTNTHTYIHIPTHTQNSYYTRQCSPHSKPTNLS